MGIVFDTWHNTTADPLRYIRSEERWHQRDMETFINPDPARCECGGSGWIPGIPDDEPCPFHGEETNNENSES